MARKLRVDHMGKIVTVKSRLDRRQMPRHNADGRVIGGCDMEWVSTPVMRQFTGWLVGFRTVWNGTTHYGSYDEPSHFQQKKGIYCALVCLWPDQKPIHVPLDGYIVGGADPQNPKRWSPKDKADYREYLRDNPPPRDRKGRFLKYDD